MVGIDGQKKVPDKGPVMLLYELFNDVHFDCSTVDGAQNNCRFKMIVNVNNNKFEGTGKKTLFCPKREERETDLKELKIWRSN